MNSTSYTIRIFVPDGDPEGIRIIDRMNWTGKGIVFPRLKWSDAKSRKEFTEPGTYLLTGYSSEDDDLPTIYVGQGDPVRDRIESHFKNKEFWDQGIAFVSTNGGLNRAHITWLEWALIVRAKEVDRSRLDNANIPQEPALSESEKADTAFFLEEILQILPLVNVRSFQYPEPVTAPIHTVPPTPPIREGLLDNDTIIVPAQKEGFEKVFLGENCWHAIRISGGMIDKIKYIAAYQSQPISSVTHFAEVDRIEPYGEGGKYKVVFTGKANPIGRSIPVLSS